MALSDMEIILTLNDGIKVPVVRFNRYYQVEATSSNLDIVVKSSIISYEQVIAIFTKVNCSKLHVIKSVDNTEMKFDGYTLKGIYQDVNGLSDFINISLEKSFSEDSVDELVEAYKKNYENLVEEAEKEAAEIKAAQEAAEAEAEAAINALLADSETSEETDAETTVEETTAGSN